MRPVAFRVLAEKKVTRFSPAVNTMYAMRVPEINNIINIFDPQVLARSLTRKCPGYPTAGRWRKSSPLANWKMTKAKTSIERGRRRIGKRNTGK